MKVYYVKQKASLACIKALSRSQLLDFLHCRNELALDGISSS